METWRVVNGFFALVHLHHLPLLSRFHKTNLVTKLIGKTPCTNNVIKIFDIFAKHDINTSTLL